MPGLSKRRFNSGLTDASVLLGRRMLLSHRRQISRASLDVMHQKCSRSDGTVFPLARAKPQEAFFALDHHVEQIP
jgi:hypothetical protein